MRIISLALIVVYNAKIRYITISNLKPIVPCTCLTATKIAVAFQQLLYLVHFSLRWNLTTKIIFNRNYQKINLCTKYEMTKV